MKLGVEKDTFFYKSVVILLTLAFLAGIVSCGQFYCMILIYLINYGKLS